MEVLNKEINEWDTFDSNGHNIDYLTYYDEWSNAMTCPFPHEIDDIKDIVSECQDNSTCTECKYNLLCNGLKTRFGENPTCWGLYDIEVARSFIRGHKEIIENKIKKKAAKKKVPKKKRVVKKKIRELHAVEVKEDDIFTIVDMSNTKSEEKRMAKKDLKSTGVELLSANKEALQLAAKIEAGKIINNKAMIRWI